MKIGKGYKGAALLMVAAGLAIAGPPGCDNRVNNTEQKLLECVTLDGVREHQAALQAIANANGGSRAAGSAGYDQSVAYFRQKLQAAGYLVSTQNVTFPTWFAVSPAILRRVTPAPAADVESFTVTYSGSGDVTAAVTSPANLGCNAADYAGFPAGNIALVQRGGCTFLIKATNAANAGAAAVIIYNNQASDPSLFNLTASSTLNLPVLATSTAVGQQLANTPGLVVRVKTETVRGDRTGANLIAETPDGNSNSVVMAGTNLDSVYRGPGINSNGSGAAALLETALMMAKVKPRNKVRFAWWTQQELPGAGSPATGVVGSQFYVNSLAPAELDKITLYLNFDTIGSPNFVYFILDGDDPSLPAGSAVIERRFEQFYDSRNLPYKNATALLAASDQLRFVAAGIPAGGITTGGNPTPPPSTPPVTKTAQEASIWGGVAGAPYDPCFNLACDTFDNVSLTALETNSDAVAAVVLHFAMNTQAFNTGVRPKGNFKLPDEPGVTQ